MVPQAAVPAAHNDHAGHWPEPGGERPIRSAFDGRPGTGSPVRGRCCSCAHCRSGSRASEWAAQLVKLWRSCDDSRGCHCVNCRWGTCDPCWRADGGFAGEQIPDTQQWFRGEQVQACADVLRESTKILLEFERANRKNRKQQVDPGGGHGMKLWRLYRSWPTNRLLIPQSVLMSVSGSRPSRSTH